MPKRLIDIDDELLAAARDASGQATIKATVTTALEHLVAEHRRREARVRERWRGLTTELDDLHNDDVMRQAWS